MEESNEDSDSDVSIDSYNSESDSDDTTTEEEVVQDIVLDPVDNDETEEKQEDDKDKENSDEEEDEIIKAIREQSVKKKDHPPIIICEDFVADISFHPFNDLLAVANIVGDVVLYKYSNEENLIVNSLELHTKACRDIEFSHDGKILFSTSKDKTIMLSDVETGKLVRFYEDSHEVPVYCLTVVDENLFATGDDDGTIKMWDCRQSEQKPIYRTKKNEDYISQIVTDEAHKYLLCSSGDGSLTTIDLDKRTVFMQSEEYDDELTCLGIFRTETKLLSGSSKGKLYLFNWNEFGLHSDAFSGCNVAINSMIPITENITIYACEDGNLRAAHLFPHRPLGIVGQHDLSVENVDICNTGKFIASSGHNNEVKFWNVQYFEDFEKLSHKQKKVKQKKKVENNLPSSNVKNVSDFFSDLA